MGVWRRDQPWVCHGPILIEISSPQGSQQLLVATAGMLNPIATERSVPCVLGPPAPCGENALAHHRCPAVTHMAVPNTDELGDLILAIQIQLDGICIPTRPICDTTLEITEKDLCDCVFVVILTARMYFSVNHAQVSA